MQRNILNQIKKLDQLIFYLKQFLRNIIYHRFPAQFLGEICNEDMPLLYYGRSLIVVFCSYWWPFYYIFSFIYKLFANANVGFLNVYKMTLKSLETKRHSKIECP